MQIVCLVCGWAVTGNPEVAKREITGHMLTEHAVALAPATLAVLQNAQSTYEIAVRQRRQAANARNN